MNDTATANDKYSMKPTFNEKLIAYLALISGLTVSAVAIYYSVAGLTAIFAAAVIPIIIMGVSLEVGKLVATIWLKQNWDTSPFLIRTYLIAAIVVLMAITSLGIFGFLSKAHQDQTIPSGDVAAKVSLIDEKIKTERENIDANRKTLTQLDAAVDQIMARSTSEEGAAKSSQIRKSQQKERGQLLADNERSQKAISVLQTEKAPIAAELRKVEAEVGPIKYIAAFFYGETNPTILEKAVTWVIITLIIVFDPLAVILLLASQTSFQQFRKREETEEDILSSNEFFPHADEKERAKAAVDFHIGPDDDTFDPSDDPGVKEFFERGKEVAQKLDAASAYEPDDGPLTEDQVKQINAKVAEQHPYLNEPFKHFENLTPMVAKIEEPLLSNGYVQNEEQQESDVWTKTISQAEYKEVSEDRRHEVEDWIDRIKTGQISYSDVPEHLLLSVKART